MLAEGKSVLFTVGGLVGARSDGSTAIAGSTTISLLQYSLLAAGLALSVLTANRISINRHGDSQVARAVAAPTIVLVLGFGALNAILFALPMAHRM